MEASLALVDDQTEAFDLDAPDEFDAWLESEGMAAEAPADPVDRDLWAEARLGALAAIEREIKHHQAVYDRRVEMLTSWLADVTRPLQRRAEYLREILEHEAMVRYREGRKTVTLPSGKIGGRARGETVRIEDHDAALEFARQTDGLREQIKVTERIGVTPLKDYLRHTGEIPPGCELVPASVRYYVMPAEEG